MTGSQDQHLRVAFHLVASRNQKARRRLIKKHIGPAALPKLKPNELELLGFQQEEIHQIKNRYLESAGAEIQKAAANGVAFIFHEDELYPKMLKQIYDPPDFLYVLGNKEMLRTEKLAVVGSRKAGNYGWQSLQRILPDLCKAGIAIVSGMAYGIDAMAHTIALSHQGLTIGINAGGLLHLYPAGNKGMIDRIIQEGCVISEFSLDTVPRPYLFPIRNRIIAGISRSILVAEAALKSGSLITARLGLEQNRDIFAIPGRIDAPISQGTNFLIQQGAKLITCAADILVEFGIMPELTPQEEFNLSKNEEKVLELMEDGEIKSVDYLTEQMDQSVSAVISLLMGLVLKSIVIDESGGYRRVK